MSKVAVIDYGMGNLHSVAKAVEFVGAQQGPVEVSVTADPQTIADADRVIFPGVGAIRDCMAEINRLDIGSILQEVVAEKPLLAICVGMQALMERSEENNGVECLGLLQGEVRFFGDPLVDANSNRLKVPHMGWNNVRQTIDHPLWQGIEDNSRFYFVHSFYVETAEKECVAGTTNYGEDFVAVIAQPNVFAVQFHPEKSQPAGLKLLANFLQWNGAA